MLAHLQTFNELANNPAGHMPLLVPWDLLTDFERRKNRFRSQEILKFLQYYGYRIMLAADAEPAAERGKVDGERSSVEKRFAFNLLEKLLQYLEQASFRMRSVKPSEQLTRRNSFKKESQDVKFFEKVIKRTTQVGLFCFYLYGCIFLFLFTPKFNELVNYAKKNKTHCF